MTVDATTVNTTVDFCAICRDTNVLPDFVTRCGHHFHFKCLWPDRYKSESSKACPYCRQNVTNFTEKEKLLSKLKNAALDKSKSDEITKFLNNLMDFKNSKTYTDFYTGYGSDYSNFKVTISSYGSELITNLLKIGWNINSKVEGGLDLLKRVCERDDLFRLNVLINAGLKLDPDSEFEKIATNTAKSSESYLTLERIYSEKILSISRNLQLITVSNDGGDQLIEACQNNNFEKVKALVEKGVDVNYRNSRGFRPIHKACASANLVIVEYLIGKGAEINCVDLSGRCPLHEACTSIYERKDVVKKLLENNAKVSYLDQDKNTQLHLAIISRKFAVAELLVDHYENVNLLNIFDESPLHLAADFSAPKSLIEKLIEKGSEINAKDFKERSALHRAVTSNTINVVDLLLAKGANANQVDSNKDTPVLLAINRPDALPFITSLIKHGADLNFKNSSGKTALEITWEPKSKA